MLTQDQARYFFSYNADTGILRWRNPRARRLRVDDEAGTVTHSNDGRRSYRRVNVSGKTLNTHTIAWLYTHGVVPDEIDHIDGDGLNNRLSNLRMCTRKQNSANKGPYSNNTSGIKGVSLCRITGRWRASITVDGRAKNLGRYDTKDGAMAAYALKAREVFGDFAHNAKPLN